VRLETVPIALDAAHIRWYQAGGPETENNGLALCVLHHKTFDLGAFTVSGGIMLVSDQANGTKGFQRSLLAYHGKPIRDPQHPDWKPEPRHLDWHRREVFKGEARHYARSQAVLCSQLFRTPHPRHFAAGRVTWMISTRCRRRARIWSATSRTRALSSSVFRTISRLPSPVTITP